MCKNCLYCNEPVKSDNPRAIFCIGTNCKVYYHRDKKRKEKLAATCCHYCAKDLDPNRMSADGRRKNRASKFCSETHKRRFHHKKRYNKPMPLQVTPKLLIWCNKYDRIPEIVAKYRRNAKDINGNADLVTRRYMPEQKAAKPEPKKKSANPYLVQ